MNIKKTTTQSEILQAKAQAIAQTLDKQVIVATKGKQQHVKVKSGYLYEISLKEGEVLTKKFNLIVKKQGSDLQVLLENNTAVIFDDYLAVCATDLSCLVSVPSAQGAYYVVENSFTPPLPPPANGSQFEQSFSEAFLSSNDASALVGLIPFTLTLTNDSDDKNSVNNITGRGGDTDDTLLGSSGIDIIYGGAGDDTIYGGGGTDWLYGEEGDDRLYGEEGDDWLYGGAGDDRLEGGAGDDTMYGGAGDDQIYGGAGDDTMYSGASSNIPGRLDWLYGEEGDDRIYGGDGISWIYGGEGDDRIYGGSGTSYIDGEEGDDWLYGGEGNDMFDYNFINAGNDIIFDFEIGYDEIDLNYLLSTEGYNSNNNDINNFIQITDYGNDAIISIDANGDGSGADVTITLLGHAGIDLDTMIADGSIVL